MAHITADRVRETSTTSGTGALTVAGAVTGYRAFSTVMTTNDTCYYAVVDNTANTWETGYGTYSSANTLTRTAVYASTNANAAVNFAANSKDVFLTIPGARVVQLDSAANLVVGSNTANGVFAVVNGAAATARGFVFRTAGVDRWDLAASVDAESGSNAGSNFVLTGHNDAGASVITPIICTRTGLLLLTGANILSGAVDSAAIGGNTPSTGVFTTLSATTLSATGYAAWSVATGISAAGTTQGTGTTLAKQINVVSTTATNTGVVLPASLAAGTEITVINRGANTLKVYPHSGGAIDALATNANATIATVTRARYVLASTNQWYTVG